MTSPTREEIAWAAGLFEGEGCVRLSNGSRGTCRRLTLNMCDKDAVERLCSIFGAGQVVPKRVYGKRKPQWLLQINDWRDVKRIVLMLLPYMCARRTAKMKELLANPPIRGSGFCKKGHPLVGPAADVYRNSLGHTSCGPCSRERERNKRLLRKVAA